MTDPDVWVGRTEIAELLDDGEAYIAGSTYRLTEAAKAEVDRQMRGVGDD